MDKFPQYNIPGQEPERHEQQPDLPEEYDRSYQQQPQYSSDNVGVMKEMDPRRGLELIRRELRGEIFDEKTNKWVQTYKPLMNNDGISKYLSLLAPILSSVTTMSKYDEETLNEMILYVFDNAIINIYVYYKEYGVRKEDLDILSNQIFVMTSSAFRKSLGAGDRNVIGRIRTENINQQARPQVKEGKGFTAFGGEEK